MVRPISLRHGDAGRRCPIRSRTRLIALITERQLKPGDRLPPERELAATMGVSRSSLREALRALAMLGVAEMRQGDGTYLTALDPETAAAPGRARAEPQRRRPGRALRGAQAGRAGAGGPGRRADRRPPLRRSCVRCAEASPEALEDAEAFMWNDIELHALIARAADNAILSGCWIRSRRMGIASRRRDRAAGEGAPSKARRTIWRSPRPSRRATRRRPERRCCATWRTSKVR